MRILLVQPGPGFSVADVARGWVRGLAANGCQVGDYRLDDRLTFYSEAHLKKRGRWVKAFAEDDAAKLAVKGVEAATYEMWPDVIVAVSAFFLPTELLDLFRRRGHRVVALFTESPYEDDRQVAVAEHVDLAVVNDPTNLERFQQTTRAVYIPHGYDPAVHHPRTRKRRHASDFCFVGTGYESRINFFEAVNWDGIDTALAGNWQQLDDASPLRKFVAHDIRDCIDNEAAADLYASTKMSANLYRREAQRPELSTGWAMGPREVELAAIGVPFLRDPRGEGDELLPMLPTFDGPDDFAERLRWWLAHDVERDAIAAAAQAAVADRTFANHAAELLRLLAA